MTDLRYWLLLQGVEGIGTVTFNRLLERFGDPEQVFHARPDEFENIPRLSDTTVANIFGAVNRIALVEEIMAELDTAGVKIVTVRDRAYPAMLAAIDHRPPLLYVRGTTDIENPIAVVGTREASAEGIKTALDFSRTFTRAGCTVVSGFAPGIDTAAHTGALDAGGNTVLVLPTGILRFSVRPELAEIWEDLVGRSTVISEFYPLADWTVGQAMARNRVTSGLSRTVVIVEIGEQGGTINTAEQARKQGKPIFYYEPLAGAGEGRLRAVGAIPVRTPAEVIARLKLS